MIHVSILIDNAESNTRIDEHVEYHTEDAGSVALVLDNAVKRAVSKAKATINADA